MTRRVPGAVALVAVCLGGCWWPDPDDVQGPTPALETPSPAPTVDPTPTDTPVPAESPSPPPHEGPSPTPRPSTGPCLEPLDAEDGTVSECRTSDAGSRLELEAPAGSLHVASAGDLDGDGLEELVIGMTALDGGGRAAAGGIYLYYGSTAGIDLEAPDALLLGAASGDEAGYARGTGDVNNDGFSDLLVGAPRADPNGAVDGGKVYLLCGGPGRLSGTVDLGGAETPLTLESMALGFGLGNRVAGAGHFNGDEYEDFMVAAPHPPDGDGHVFVIYGQASLCEAGGQRAEIKDIASVEVRVPPKSHEGLGGSIAPAGDVDGDGYDDLLLGAPGDGSSMAGAAYLIFGGDYPSGTVFTVQTASTSTIAYLGEQPGDSFGQSVGAGGDLDGDGRPDLVVGAPGFDGAGYRDGGAVYVLTGIRRPEAGNRLEVADAGAVRLPELSEGARFGSMVAVVTDLDGDGLDELLAGAPAAEETGVAWLYRGVRAAGPVRSVRFPGDGAGDGQGVWLAGADLDGTGGDELAICALRAGAAEAGEVYLYLPPE